MPEQLGDRHKLFYARKYVALYKKMLPKYFSLYKKMLAGYDAKCYKKKH